MTSSGRSDAAGAGGDPADREARIQPSGAPRGAPTASPVLVGVSGVTGSRQALQWAVHEARLRGGRVRAVMAWRSSGLPGGAPGRAPAQSVLDADPQQQFAEQNLADFVAEALGDDHDVELEAVEGRARDVLLREAQDAALLVLDSPAVSKLYEPAARRLAPQIIFRSPCPVVVMPPAEPEADADLDDGAGEYADDAAAPTATSSPERS